ncbi:MAG: hypothetical protein M1812_001425 [Candelaria pacifica]|nr:MAG: hypothetical protein M1812_001425 [Candelaria pacifica]
MGRFLHAIGSKARTSSSGLKLHIEDPSALDTGLMVCMDRHAYMDHTEGTLPQCPGLKELGITPNMWHRSIFPEYATHEPTFTITNALDVVMRKGTKPIFTHTWELETPGETDFTGRYVIPSSIVASGMKTFEGCLRLTCDPGK